MKNKTIIYLSISAVVAASIFSLTSSCTNKRSDTPVSEKNAPTGSNVSADAIDTLNTVIDVDENVYHTLTLGTQVWMLENLKVTRFRNGDKIPNLKDDTQWSKFSPEAAYCNYNNDTTNNTIYGRLYNWYAVNDSRKIAPENWHIPTVAEWTTLINYLGGNNVAGGKLKESNTTHWDNPNTGATNETGFTALPGGERNNNGMFTNIGFSGGWWTATGSDGDFATNVGMIFNNATINADIDDMKYGYSVRCLRDY